MACTALYNWVRFAEGDIADILLEDEINSEKKAQDIQLVIKYLERAITSKKIDAFQNNLVERI